MNGPAAALAASCSTPPASVDVAASAFEGLFQVALQPEGAFAWGLALAGLDLGHIRERYPIVVWVRTLEVARKHVFGDLPEPEGMRKLGRLQCETDLASLTGRMLGATFPMLGVRRILEQTHRSFATSRPDLNMEVVPEGERSVRLKVSDRFSPREFMAGYVEVCVERCKESPQVAIENDAPEHFDLTVRW